VNNPSDCTDEMGLGKTAQLICFLGALPPLQSRPCLSHTSPLYSCAAQYGDRVQKTDGKSCHESQAC